MPDLRQKNVRLHSGERGMSKSIISEYGVNGDAVSKWDKEFSGEACGF